MSTISVINKDDIESNVRPQTYVSQSGEGRFDQLQSTDLLKYLTDVVGDEIGFDFDTILDVNLIDIQQRWDISSGQDGLSFEIVDLGTNRLTYTVNRLQAGEETELDGDPGFEASGPVSDFGFDPFKNAENDFAEQNDFVIVYSGVFDAKNAGDYAFSVDTDQKVEVTFGDAETVTILPDASGNVTFPLEAGLHRFEFKVTDLASERDDAGDIEVSVVAPGAAEPEDLFAFVSHAPDGLYDVTVNALIDGVQDTFTFVVTDLADVKSRIVDHYGEAEIAEFGVHDGPVSLAEITNFMGGTTIAELETLISSETPKTFVDFLGSIEEIEGNLSVYGALQEDYFGGRDINDTKSLLDWFKASASLENVLAVNTFSSDNNVAFADTLEIMRAVWEADFQASATEIQADFTALSEAEFIAQYSQGLHASLTDIGAAFSGDNTAIAAFMTAFNTVQGHAVDLLTFEAILGAAAFRIPNFQLAMDVVESGITYQTEFGVLKSDIVAQIGQDPADLKDYVDNSALPLDELPEEQSRELHVTAATEDAFGIEDGGTYTFSGGGAGTEVELIVGEDSLVTIDDTGSTAKALAETAEDALTVDYTFEDGGAFLAGDTAVTIKGSDKKEFKPLEVPPALLNNDTFKEPLEQIINSLADVLEFGGVLPLDLGLIEVAPTLDASIGLDIQFGWDIDLPSLGQTITNQPIDYTVAYPDEILEGSQFSVYIDEVIYKLPTTVSSVVEIGKVDINANLQSPETQFGGIGVSVKSSPLTNGSVGKIASYIAPDVVEAFQNSPIGMLDGALDGLFELSVQLDKTISLEEILAVSESLAQSFGVEVDLSKGFDIGGFIEGLFTGDEAVLAILDEMQTAFADGDYIGAFNAFLKVVGVGADPEEEEEVEEEVTEGAEPEEEVNAMDEKNIVVETEDGGTTEISARDLLKISVESQLKEAANTADTSGTPLPGSEYVQYAVGAAETIHVKYASVTDKLDELGVSSALETLTLMFTEGIEVVTGLTISGELPFGVVETQVGFTGDDETAVSNGTNVSALHKLAPTQIISEIDTKVLDVQLDFNEFSNEVLTQALDQALVSPALDPATKGVLVAVRSALAIQPLLIDTFEEGASGSLKVSPAAFLQALTNVFLESFDAVAETVEFTAGLFGLDIDIIEDGGFADDEFLSTLFTNPDNLEVAVKALTDPLIELFTALPKAFAVGMEAIEALVNATTDAATFTLGQLQSFINSLEGELYGLIDGVMDIATTLDFDDFSVGAGPAKVTVPGISFSSPVKDIFEVIGFDFNGDNVDRNNSTVFAGFDTIDQVFNKLTEITELVGDQLTTLTGYGSDFSNGLVDVIEGAFSELPEIASLLIQGVEAGVDLDINMNSINLDASVTLQQTTIFNPNDLIIEYTYMDQVVQAKYGEAVVFTAPEFMDATNASQREVDVKIIYDGAYDYVYTLTPDINFDMEHYGFTIQNNLSVGGSEIYDFEFDYAFVKTVGEEDWDPHDPATWFDDALVEIPTADIKKIINEQLIDTIRDLGLDALGELPEDLNLESGEVPFFFIDGVPSITGDGEPAGFTSIDDSVLLELKNLRPLIEDIDDQTNDQGSVLVEVGSYFSEPDGDAMVFSAEGLPDGVNVKTLEDGRVVLSGSAAPGDYSITVTADDQNGGATALSFDWVVNAIGSSLTQNTGGTAGDDEIVETGEKTDIFAGQGDDAVTAVSNAAHIDGGGGHDLLVGGFEGDTLIGGEGNDMIRGDIITFLSGQDSINGGIGDDLLSGGAKADVFIFATGDGNDVIAGFGSEEVNNGSGDYSAFELEVDFNVTWDKVQLNDFEGINADNVLDFVTQGENGAVFEAQGTQITFWDVQQDELLSDSFNFA